jgi:hypothetical protein
MRSVYEKVVVTDRSFDLAQAALVDQANNADAALSRMVERILAQREEQTYFAARLQVLTEALFSPFCGDCRQ